MLTDSQKRTILDGFNRMLTEINWQATATGADLPEGIKSMKAQMQIYVGSHRAILDSPLASIKQIAKDSLEKKGLFGAPITRHPMTQAFYSLVNELRDESLQFFAPENLNLFIRLANQFVAEYSPIANVDPLFASLLKQAANDNSAEVFALLFHAVSDDKRNQVLAEMLFYVASKNADQIILFLLAQRANVTLQRADSRQTALHVAARVGADKAVSVLLAGGANAAIPDLQRQTPLHVAVACQKENVVSILATRDAVDKQDLQGNTAAHIAANLGLDGVLSALRDKGASFDIANNAGKTVIQINAERRAAHARSQTVILTAGQESGRCGSCCTIV